MPDNDIPEINIEDQLRQGYSWDDSVSDVEEIEASGQDGDLFKDNQLAALVGIPFLIVGGTFREKKVKEGGEYKTTDFVTLMCIVGSEKEIAKRGGKLQQLIDQEIVPEQWFLMNDGSTGIRRQIVTHLYKKDMINLVEDGTKIITSGSRDECTYDLRVSEWDSIKTGDMKFNKNGLAIWDFKLPNGLLAPRGLRINTYLGGYGKDVTTRYLR
jgi:hypothetical protein